MMALVDCNNFYVSCERVFRPDLDKKPVVVLSNNDGCIVSRSKEIKKLGIPNGAPIFKYKDSVERYKIAIFSSNYPLYEDLSNRVFQTLCQFSPKIERYSIDEAFLEFNETTHESRFLLELGKRIKATVEKWTGIPVSVGFGATKTLAKAANYVAKSCHDGVFYISPQNGDIILNAIPIEELWGIGRKYSQLLRSHHIATILSFKNAPTLFIKKRLHIPGVRTQQELCGQMCYPLDMAPLEKKQIISSKSFGTPIYDFESLMGAICENILCATEKLRRQKSVAFSLSLFIQTSRFRPNYYSNSIEIELYEGCNDPSVLSSIAEKWLHRIYKPELAYKKSGVLLSKIQPQHAFQSPLFQTSRAHEKSKRLTEALDSINKKWGKHTLTLARCKRDMRTWKMNQLCLSGRYTTQWLELAYID